MDMPLKQLDSPNRNPSGSNFDNDPDPATLDLEEGSFEQEPEVKARVKARKTYSESRSAYFTESEGSINSLDSFARPDTDDIALKPIGSSISSPFAPGSAVLVAEEVC